MKMDKARNFLKAFAAGAVVTMVSLVTVPAVSAHEEDSPQGVSVGDAQTVDSLGAGLLWQGKVYTDKNGVKIQYAGLTNGVIARMTFDEKTGVFHVGATNGADYDIDMERLAREGSDYASFEAENRKRPNKCQVATGIAGIAHTTLWSAAVGGPWGAVAGLGYGLFWWAVGSQC